MSSERALITGIAGQDGSYLAELLLAKGYEVHGVVRQPLESPLANIEHVRGEIELHRADVTDGDAMRALIGEIQPDELYHLAAPTFVPDSWRDPAGTLAAIAVAGASLLSLVAELAPAARVFVPSSGEIFGDADESPQRETTSARPSNPYAVAKLALHQLVGVVRRDGLHASSGITYNHESERRPERFVTRKVTRAVAAISLGLEDELVLGSMDAVRDWSHAADVVRAAWMMVRSDEPEDYVIASGVGRTVRELVEVAFSCAGLDPQDHIRIDPTLARAPETCARIGDPALIQARLGWEPEWSFERLIESMVESDRRRLREQATGSAARDLRRP